MDIEVIATLCHDVDFIREVIMELWDDISEDGANKEEWTINPDYAWIECVADGQRLGLVQLNDFNYTTLQLHMNIRRAYRKKYTRDITHAGHEWLLKNVDKRIQKYVAMIPELFPNVAKFALDSGWEKEGELSKAYSKCGRLYNLGIYGITKDKMEKVTWGQQ